MECVSKQSITKKNLILFIIINLPFSIFQAKFSNINKLQSTEIKNIENSMLHIMALYIYKLPIYICYLDKKRITCVCVDTFVIFCSCSCQFVLVTLTKKESKYNIHVCTFVILYMY